MATLWDLRWFYFGDTNCLLTDSPKECDFKSSIKESLFSKMNGMVNSDFKKMLIEAEDGNASKLMKILYEDIKAKKCYRWEKWFVFGRPWPDELRVRIANMDIGIPSYEMILSAERMILPWPLDVENSLSQETSDRFKNKLIHNHINLDTKSKFNPETDIYLYAFLKTLDDLVMADPDTNGDRPLDQKNGEEIKDIVKNKASSTGLAYFDSYPKGFEIDVKEKMSSDKTKISSIDGHLIVTLGLNPNGSDGRCGHGMRKFPCDSLVLSPDKK